MEELMKFREVTLSLYHPYIFFLLFVFSFSGKATVMNEVKYLASFKTNRSACMARVNNIPLINNFQYSSGSVTAGFNITSFVENGSNSLEILMGAVNANDSKTLYSDSTCELIITKDTPNSSEILTSLVLSVDKDGNIIPSRSSNDNNSIESRLDEQQFAEDQKQKLYRVGRSVKFSQVPEWAWVNATPVSDKALPRIKEAYRTIWKEMKARNVAFFKEITTVSNAEMGRAEGMSAESFFDSYGFAEKLTDPDLSPTELNVDKYKLVTYCDGRIFRLAHGVLQNSPLRLRNSEGRIVFAYNPYLAIVDGRIIVVR